MAIQVLCALLQVWTCPVSFCSPKYFLFLPRCDFVFFLCLLNADSFLGMCHWPLQCTVAYQPFLLHWHGFLHGCFTGLSCFNLSVSLFLKPGSSGSVLGLGVSSPVENSPSSIPRRSGRRHSQATGCCWCLHSRDTVGRKVRGYKYSLAFGRYLWVFPEVMPVWPAEKPINHHTHTCTLTISSKHSLRAASHRHQTSPFSSWCVTICHTPMLCSRTGMQAAAGVHGCPKL